MPNDNNPRRPVGQRRVQPADLLNEMVNRVVVNPRVVPNPGQFRNIINDADIARVREEINAIIDEHRAFVGGVDAAPKPAKAEKLPMYKVFWGGADVDPGMYNRQRSDWCGPSNINRDKADADEMNALIDAGIPVIGICRSAQLLNVLNGGILVQHIDGHANGRAHKIALQWKDDNLVTTCNSTHHQMMVPHKDGHIIGRAPFPMKGVHWENTNEWHEYNSAIEVVYYPKTKSLCIQPHPEWMDQDSQFVRWIQNFCIQELGLPPINFAHEEMKA